MNGVTILETIPIQEIHIPTIFILVIIILLPSITGIIINLFSYKQYADYVGNIMSLILGLVILVIVGFTDLGLHDSGEYEYKVKVDKEVSLNDFNKYYEIIKYEDEFLIVKERQEIE